MANAETALKRAIVDAVNRSGLAVVFSCPAGRALGGRVRLAPEGTPDVLGYMRRGGRHVAIEIKLPNGKLSPAQALAIDDMRKSGCVTGVARSVADAVGLLLREAHM